MDLVKIRVDRVIGSPKQEFAVVLRCDEKAFLIFVGEHEAVAIFRELRGLKVQRPLPHDLVMNVMTAFDISARTIAISSIVQNVFCATLLLTQEVEGGTSERNEVRIDLRASDAIIMSQKLGKDLFVSREVLDQVDDVTPLLSDADDYSGGTDDPLSDGKNEQGQDD